MIDKGSYIKGYAEAYGNVKGYVISADYGDNLRVAIHKPKRYRGKAVWVYRYGTHATIPAKEIS
jgi:hypothetical protein